VFGKTIALFLLLVSGGDIFAAVTVSEWRVRFDGYGPVGIGMTPQEASKTLGTILKGDIDAKRSCYYVESATLEGISFMVTDGQISRIDVYSEKIPMDSGAKIGHTIKEIMAIYPGRTKVDPHLYTGPEGKYLTVTSMDRVHGIRFETSSMTGRVDRYYVGKFPEIQFPEGCF
jgi:hypothetical protein